MASQRLRARGATLITGAGRRSRSVPGRCSLDDGRTPPARAGGDRRARARAGAMRGAGFQKFVGLELELRADHGRARC